MKCPKCKAKASEEDEYCNKCGSPLKKVEKETKEEKRIAIWAWLVCFIIFLVCFVSLYPYLKERNITKEISGRYFIETKYSCEEADIKAEVNADMFDTSKDLMKKDECVDECQEKGYIYSGYGCKNNVFVCYCNDQISKEIKRTGEMEEFVLKG